VKELLPKVMVEVMSDIRRKSEVNLEERERS
jgi:hypothetical protein